MVHYGVASNVVSNIADPSVPWFPTWLQVQVHGFYWFSWLQPLVPDSIRNSRRVGLFLNPTNFSEGMVVRKEQRSQTLEIRRIQCRFKSHLISREERRKELAGIQAPSSSLYPSSE